jgi:two-component system response regulator
MSKGGEILLIEDNPDEAALAIRSLKKNNFNLIHIDDGVDALDFIFARNKYSDRTIENGPKLILLDLKLPKVDGLDILKAMKADPRTRLIPIIVLTSSKEEQDIIACYRLGANSYVIKPVNFDVFSKAIVDLGTYWMLMNVPPVTTTN